MTRNPNVFCITGPLCGQSAGDHWASEGQIFRALVFSLLLLTWTSCWTNGQVSVNLKRHELYDVTVMTEPLFPHSPCLVPVYPMSPRPPVVAVVPDEHWCWRNSASTAHSAGSHVVGPILGGRSRDICQWSHGIRIPSERCPYLQKCIDMHTALVTLDTWQIVVPMAERIVFPQLELLSSHSGLHSSLCTSFRRVSAKNT